MARTDGFWPESSFDPPSHLGQRQPVPSHSFVAAQLRSVVPMYARAANRTKRPPTTPFLALHLHEFPDADEEWYGTEPPNLFLLSNQKPTAPGSEYFIVTPSTTSDHNDSEKTLTVSPPLPCDEPLYLSVTPRFSAQFFDNTAYETHRAAQAYHLDEPSLKKLRQALETAGPSIPGTREILDGRPVEGPGEGSGEGSDGESDGELDESSEVGDREHCYSRILVENQRVPLYFDLVAFADLTAEMVLQPAVYDEVRLYRQFYLDFTWKGIEWIFDYLDILAHDLPQRIAAGIQVFCEPVRLAEDGNIPDPTIDAFRPSLAHLQTLPVLYPGDPVDPSNPPLDEWSLGWNDGAPYTMPEAEYVPAVLPGDVKLVVTDCDVLVDRDGPLLEVLSSVFPSSVYHRNPLELLHLFVEYEVLRRSDDLSEYSGGSDSAPLKDSALLEDPSQLEDTRSWEDFGRSEDNYAVIRDIARYLHTHISDSSIRSAFSRLRDPALRPGTAAVVSSLLEHGYTVLILPSDLPRSTFASLDGISYALWDAHDRNFKQNQSSPEAEPLSQNVDSTLPLFEPYAQWDDLVDLVRRELNLSLSADQILVASSNLPEVVEAASRHEFLTALIRRAGSRSAAAKLSTVAPTFDLVDFNALLPALLGPGPQAIPPYTPPPGPALGLRTMLYRFRDCYQIETLLAEGTYTSVWDARQMHTGKLVALKYQPVESSNPNQVAYEAAVYAQLEGVRGVVPIRWSGTDGEASVLVMDRLGPTLGDLRRVCRGAFSLKTVLMIAEQMITTIEGVHARGIVYRDIKPDNFATGLLAQQHIFVFDMGLARCFLDPDSGEHMPFRDDRAPLGTPRYYSHNVHLGIEPSRRDDMEAIGFLLLYFLHSRLPWQGFRYKDETAALKHAGDMKHDQPLTDLLSRSPACFTTFFDHCRSLAFDEKPDYALLRGILRREMRQHGWEYDWKYDWLCPDEAPRGTLYPPEQYNFDLTLVDPVRHEQKVL
ncbi:hypothetical protein EIP91_004784 [Steccherinum ochraceum]|uniref:Protein kinase domain-containing protein n=1 Tax=Steccherinum ochraceum TaxID=92696 RepID=A0A4R0REB0_9APHY|nr:hypothetical protein EIP91_004784 [Steccherinum ochraceum]